MNFFIPAAKDETQAEEVYESIKRFAKQTTGWDITRRRIFALMYRHDGQLYDVEVGKPDPRVSEVVVAILESVKTLESVAEDRERSFTLPSTPYLICTLRGDPIMVGKDEVLYEREFESA